MSAKELIEDPECCSSVLWLALEKLFGVSFPVWEVETFYIELRRKEIEPTASLMAKILSTQTIKTTYTWSYDYDVFFAFALACDGISASSEQHHHPEVEQLCWAVREIETLLEIKITDDQGFDPDAVDPAVAVILKDDGYSNAPDALEFADDVLAPMVEEHTDLRKDVKKVWSVLKGLSSTILRSKIDGKATSSLDVQIAKLVGCELYIREKEILRAKQLANLNVND